MAGFENSTLNIRGVQKARDMDTYQSAQNIASASVSRATVNLIVLLVSRWIFFFKACTQVTE